MTGTEIEITADLVRDLLQEQHPDLAGLAIREVVGGWGNQMWRLGDELAVRMQRMDRTPELQLKERRWLPVLAPLLPLPVPTPVRFGEPSERFLKHWTVMTWVPGEPLDRGLICRGAHAADTLAGFLQALHVEASAEAPIATDRGAHPRNCTDGFEHFFRAVAPGDIAADVRAVWDDAVAAQAWEGPPVWVHGGLVVRVVSTRPELVRSWVADAAGIGDPGFEWHDLARIWQTPQAGEDFWDQQLAVPAQQRAGAFQMLGVPAEAALDLASHLSLTMADCILDLYRSAVDVGKLWGPDFAAIPAPGLVIIPGEDPFLSAPPAARAAGRAGATTVALYGLGHWWMLQDPARAAAVLCEFWATVA